MKALSVSEKQELDKFIKSREDCILEQVDGNLSLCYVKTMVEEKYLIEYVKTPYI